MNAVYYVYAILDPTRSNTVFYIGKGKGVRANYSSKYSPHNRIKQARITKIRAAGLEPIVRILRSGLSEPEALTMEKQVVQFFGRKCDGSGTLTNLTEGGDGTSGYRHTDEDRRRMSQIQKAIVERDGARPHSEEHKQRLRDDNPGGKATAKPIFQIGTDGIVVREWPTAIAASIGLNGNRAAISQCALHHKHRISSGFYWRFVDDPDVVSGRLTNIDELNLRRTQPKQVVGIAQISPSGEIVATYASIKEAAATNPNLLYATLWAAEKYGRAYKGYLWKKTA